MQTIMAVLRALNLKKVRQTAISICSGLPHPTSYRSRIVCRGQEGPKSSKGTLRHLISRLMYLIYAFLKANVTTRNRKEAVRKFRYI